MQPSELFPGGAPEVGHTADDDSCHPKTLWGDFSAEVDGHCPLARELKNIPHATSMTDSRLHSAAGVLRRVRIYQIVLFYSSGYFKNFLILYIVS